MKHSALISIVFVLFGFGCTDEKGDIELSIQPGTPKVFNRDYESADDNGNVTVVNAPWFQARINASNNTEKDITITNLSYEVAYRVNGKLERDAAVTLTLDGCFILNELNPKSTTVEGEAANQHVGQTASGGTDCAAIDSDTPIYFESLPETEDLKYTIRLKAEGWIGDKDNPKERLTSSSLTFKAD